MTDNDIRDIVGGSFVVAQIVVNYYLELRKCGLDDKQALDVAIAYQHSILTGLKSES